MFKLLTYHSEYTVTPSMQFNSAQVKTSVVQLRENKNPNVTGIDGWGKTSTNQTFRPIFLTMPFRLQTTKININTILLSMLWSPPIQSSRWGILELLTYHSKYMVVSQFNTGENIPSTTEIGYCSGAFLYPCSTFLPFAISTAPDRCSQERPKEDLQDPSYIILSCN